MAGKRDTVILEDAGGSMSKGSRPSQQDRFAVVLPYQFHGKTDATLALFAVCDGHVSDEVSSHAIQNVPRLVMESPELANGNYGQAIISALRKEDDLLYTLYSQGHGKYAVSGSTAAVCLVDLTNGVLITGNLGDSRILLGGVGKGEDVEETEIKCLTRTHKPASPSEMHRIESAGGCINIESGTPRIGSLNMSRSLGDLRYKKPLNNEAFHLSREQKRAMADSENFSHGDFISSEPAIHRARLQDSKRYALVLATDGVTDVLSDEDIVHQVTPPFWHAETDAEGASSLITAHSATRPKCDNATAVSVFLRGAKA